MNTDDWRDRNLVAIRSELDRRIKVLQKHETPPNHQIRSESSRRSLTIKVDGGEHIEVWCKLTKFKVDPNIVEYGITISNDLAHAGVNEAFHPSKWQKDIKLPSTLLGYSIFSTVDPELGDKRSERTHLLAVTAKLDGTTRHLTSEEIDVIVDPLAIFVSMSRSTFRNSGMGSLHPA